MDIHSAFSPREAFVESSFSIVEKKVSHAGVTACNAPRHELQRR